DVLPPNTTFVSLTKTLVIPAGSDFFKTTSGSPAANGTWYDLNLPPNFFGSGSLPFTGRAFMGGVPSGPQGYEPSGFCPIPAGFFDPGSQYQGIPADPFCGGPGFSQTDTIVRRNASNAMPPGGSAIVPIEIVALQLVSVQPITVNYSARPPEQWNVSSTLPPVA